MPGIVTDTIGPGESKQFDFEVSGDPTPSCVIEVTPSNLGVTTSLAGDRLTVTFPATGIVDNQVVSVVRKCTNQCPPGTTVEDSAEIRLTATGYGSGGGGGDTCPVMTWNENDPNANPPASAGVDVPVGSSRLFCFGRAIVSVQQPGGTAVASASIATGDPAFPNHCIRVTGNSAGAYNFQLDNIAGCVFNGNATGGSTEPCDDPVADGSTQISDSGSTTIPFLNGPIVAVNPVTAGISAAPSAAQDGAVVTVVDLSQAPIDQNTGNPYYGIEVTRSCPDGSTKTVTVYGDFTSTFKQAAPSNMVRSLLSDSDPALNVPSEFSGIHLSTHLPGWFQGTGGNPIAAPNYQYDYVRNLKVTINGLEERGFWSNIELSPGNYDWQYMDLWMAAHGNKPVVWLIYGTPTFYQKYPGEPSLWGSWPGIASPPKDSDLAAMVAFAAAAKARYSNIIGFEVWNEPTFPWAIPGWNITATDFDTRWDVTPGGWADAAGKGPGFFTGSPKDLINMAYAMKNGGLGVPIIGPSFVDVSTSQETTVERFLNGPVTYPTTNGEKGCDQIDKFNFHYYLYRDGNPQLTPRDLIDVILGYKAKVAATGKSYPFVLTETGAYTFGACDPAAADFIKQVALIAALMGVEMVIYYNHAIPVIQGSQPYTRHYIADFTTCTIAQQAVDFVKANIAGTTFCSGGELSNGQLWAQSPDGTEIYT